MEALGDYSAFGPPVQHSLTTLQVLFNTVPQQFSAFQEVSADRGLLEQRARLSGAAIETGYENGRENRVPTSIFATASEMDAMEPELESLFFESGDFVAFDASLGPNDMSWLTAAPFN